MKRLIQTSIFVFVIGTTINAQLWKTDLLKQYDGSGKDVIETALTKVDDFLSKTSFDWQVGNFYADSMKQVEKAECEFILSMALITDKPSSSGLEGLVKYAQKLIEKNKKNLPVVSIKTDYETNGTKKAVVYFTYLNDGSFYFSKEVINGNVLNLAKKDCFKVTVTNSTTNMGLISEKNGSGVWINKKYAQKGKISEKADLMLKEGHKKGNWESLKKEFKENLKH